MTEQKLQHNLIMKFSQKHPEQRGLLFEVNNDTVNMKHAVKRRSMGMIAGVSDLVYVIPKCAIIAGIELKAEGSTHKTTHIKNQIEWGQKIIDQGGFYLITSSLDNALFFIESLMNDDYISAIKLQQKCILFAFKQMNKKTIKF